MRNILNIVFSLFGDIFTDTLTKDGKWSRMNLIMFSAWIFVIISAALYFAFSGFHFEVWLTFVGVALSGKLIDAKTKQMNK